MRRIYKQVSLSETAEGWQVSLDGRPIRTPARAPLAIPAKALAEAVAAEWDAQGDIVRPDTMPLTGLANVAIDRAVGQRAAMVAAVAAYAETDLLCYRDDGGGALAALQRDQWQPLLDWATSRYDALLVVTAGVMHRRQPETAVKALRAAVEALDPWRLAALQNAVGASGSLVLGLALLEGRIEADQAFELSQLDESFQMAKWGEDAEASARRAALRADLAATGRFLALLPA